MLMGQILFTAGRVVVGQALKSAIAAEVGFSHAVVG
jgi:hypothetical protein